MHWFYLSDIQGKTFQLPESESKHCSKVLRLDRGDTIFVTNGKGSLYECKIFDDNSKKTTVEIINEFVNYRKRNYKLHLAVAPTKTNDRFEWFLEKATEIGIDEITPIVCFHSERRKINQTRYNKVLEAAMKQSYKAYHPQLNEIVIFDKIIKKYSDFEHKYIAHCLDGEKAGFFQSINPNTESIVFIGPEGGFSPEEVSLAILNGFVPVNLGQSRLRTETAAIVACTAVSIINQ